RRRRETACLNKRRSSRCATWPQATVHSQNRAPSGARFLFSTVLAVGCRLQSVDLHVCRYTSVMTDTSVDLSSVVESARADISQSASIDQLEHIRVRLLGKKGEITALLKSLGGMDPEARRTAGAKINEAKDRLIAAIEDKRAALEAQA